MKVATSENADASPRTEDVGAVRPLLDIAPATPRRKIAATPDRSRPIFLHSLWRSGSTYVWSRFRTLSDACCYYEPLHDGLRRLTPQRIARATPDAVAANHHPVLSKPYFAEFEPLVAGRRGPPGFRRRFAYHRYALTPDAEDAPLEAYLRRLIDHADRRGQRPVLGINRADLRVGWMRRRFRAFSIIVEREPLDVFASYLSQMSRGNSYYFERLLLIAELNADHCRVFDYPASLARVRGRLERAFVRPKTFYRKVAESADPSRLYALTFHAWLVQLLHGLSHADLAVDFSLAETRGYADALSDRIEQESGLRVAFDDMRLAGPRVPIALDGQAAIEAEVMARLSMPALEPFIDRAHIARRLGDLSPRKAALVERLL